MPAEPVEGRVVGLKSGGIRSTYSCGVLFIDYSLGVIALRKSTVYNYFCWGIPRLRTIF